MISYGGIRLLIILLILHLHDSAGFINDESSLSYELNGRVISLSIVKEVYRIVLKFSISKWKHTRIPPPELFFNDSEAFILDDIKQCIIKH